MFDNSSVIDTLVGKSQKKRKIKELGLVFEPSSDYYNYILPNDFDINNNIHVINLTLKSNFQSDILEKSFELHHKNFNNVKFYNLKNISKNYRYTLLKKKNIYAAQLFLLKELVNKYFKDNDYIFLIDSNFFFLSPVNRLIFNKDICVSNIFKRLIFRNMEDKIYDSWSEIIDYILNINKKINIYCNKINFNSNINVFEKFNIIGLPIYFKKTFFESIIDRWIELTCLMNENNISISLSFVLLEMNFFVQNENILDICYNTTWLSFKNKNYILFNYEKPLISHITNIKIFDRKTYIPWNIINHNFDSNNYKSIDIFINNFNSIIIQIINALSPPIKSV